MKFAILLSSAGLVTAAGLPPLGYERRLMRSHFDKRSSDSSESCHSGPAPSITAPKTNVWAPLSAEDNLAVWNLLHDPSTGLNLTLPDEATQTDNYVFWIDALHTNKTDVLPYLDGDAEPPAKYGRAIIFEGGKEEPISQEYMIGPLPVSEETTVAPLDYMYNGGSGGAVPFNGRYFDSTRSAATDPLITEVMTSIADITSALFQGAVYYGSDNDSTTLTYTSGTPLSFDGTQSFRNIMFRFPGSATYMTPLDFFIQIDCTGTDASTYSLTGIVTNERYFTTIDELRSAFDAGELAMEFTQTLDSNWSMVDYKAAMGARDLEDQFAPSSIELGGKRYKVDAEQQYVEYMGWSFYMSFSRTLGIMFYDIKFKGERILYELCLQEAVAQYGGRTPKAANTVYHDTYYSLGTDMGQLIEGFDCPFGSTMWNVTYHDGNTTVTTPGAICIFEADIGYPVSRHRAGGGDSDYNFRNFGVVKGSALTVRAIATVGNYDYMFDYTFNLDASMEVVVRASGYLQSSFYYPDQGKWGPRIYDSTQGSLHEHVLTYKADFDLISSANSFQTSALKAVEQSQLWFPNLGNFTQIELDVSYLETEDRFNWAANGEVMYCVVNRDALNTWGTERGYRILPGRSVVHLSIQDSPWSLGQTEFSKTHAAVTRQHDYEPLANSVQNINLPWKPQHNFSKFFDDESLDQEDLVVWFNLGMHHYTRAEDVPVTLYTEAYSSMSFHPQNFFDRAQDGDLKNRRWVVAPDDDDEEGGGGLEYDTYGVELPSCMVELEEPADGILPVEEL